MRSVPGGTIAELVEAHRDAEAAVRSRGVGLVATSMHDAVERSRGFGQLHFAQWLRHPWRNALHSLRALGLRSVFRFRPAPSGGVGAVEAERTGD